LAKIIIAGGQLMDAATLEDSSALAANYPLANLLDLQPGRKTRFSTPAAAYVVVDLGEAKPVTFAGLLAHNGSASGTWRVRAADSEADLTADPGFDTGTSEPLGLYPASGKHDADVQHSFAHFPSESYRWWRVDVDDTGNADGFFSLGRLMLAAAWAPSVNFSFGAGLGRIDPSTIDEGVGGHLFPLKRPTKRVWTLSFRYQTEADSLGGQFELQRQRGASGDVFVVPDPDDDEHLHRRMVQGLMRGTTQPLSLEFFKRYGFAVRIEELPV
jgi:hypothetical protein